MKSVGELTTTFGARKRVVSIEIVAVVLGSLLVGDRWLLAMGLLAAGVLCSSRARAHSTTGEFVGLIERVALVCVVGASIAPPLASWVIGGAVAVSGVLVCRLTIDLLTARPASLVWRPRDRAGRQQG